MRFSQHGDLIQIFNVPDWKDVRYIKNPTSEVVFLGVLLNNVFIEGNLAPFTHLAKWAGLEAASLTGSIVSDHTFVTRPPKYQKLAVGLGLWAVF